MGRERKKEFDGMSTAPLDGDVKRLQNAIVSGMAKMDAL
jgi:hypothetical protein